MYRTSVCDVTREIQKKKKPSDKRERELFTRKYAFI